MQHCCCVCFAALAGPIIACIISCCASQCCWSDIRGTIISSCSPTEIISSTGQQARHDVFAGYGTVFRLSVGLCAGHRRRTLADACCRAQRYSEGAASQPGGVLTTHRCAPFLPNRHTRPDSASGCSILQCRPVHHCLLACWEGQSTWGQDAVR